MPMSTGAIQNDALQIRHFGRDAEIQRRDVKVRSPQALRASDRLNGELPSMAWIPASMPE